MSVCHALSGVFGVNAHIKNTRGIDENSKDLTRLHHVHLHWIPNGMTVYNHILSLSSTCKKARKIIKSALDQRLSFYPIFHVLNMCDHISDGTVRLNALQDFRERIKVHRETVKRFIKSRKHVSRAKVIRSSFRTAREVLHKDSLRVNLVYVQRKKQVIKPLIHASVPKKMFLYGESVQSRIFSANIKELADKAIERLIDTKHHREKHYLKLYDDLKESMKE